MSLPKPLKRPLKRRPPERKPMTVCLAGIASGGGDPSIIAVFDRKLSLYGGLVSGEGMAFKFRNLCTDWYVMFSGPVSPMVPLLDAIVEQARKPRKAIVLRSFAFMCSKAYRSERKRIIETEILSDYDIDSYAEYLDLKTSDNALFENISKVISTQEEQWSLLFFGFDSRERPHLFVISERGKIQYCDIENFAVIGSGALAASVAFSSIPRPVWAKRGPQVGVKTTTLGGLVYRLLAAKFASEAADGVGEETVAFVVEPRRGNFAPPRILDSEVVESVREQWKSLIRIPEGVDKEIDKAIEKERKNWAQMVKRHKKRETKLLAGKA